jgi:hypothetical protein
MVKIIKFTVTRTYIMNKRFTVSVINNYAAFISM